VKDIIEEMSNRLDEDILPALLSAISVPTVKIKDDLNAAGLPFTDPENQVWPSLRELDATAAKLIHTAATRSTITGAVSGAAGAAGVPPEVVASMLQDIRQAQRMSVLYGVDPESDRGRVLLWRALGAAWQVPVPEQGSLELRMRDLPGAFGSQVPAPTQAAAWMTRRIVHRAVRQATSRFWRWIPGVATGLSAAAGRKRAKSHGERMRNLYRRAWTGEPLDLRGSVEVEEVKSK
jgi:hypothetical protein